ncbi:helix-turn-helix domain-containing protein [Sporosarcina sp. Marseille-Q4063]|uniref:helix-turn-helix domain-containing protein n=1 Tax=Sporosarcina sp. Marseille-Q4063 TaxID=2810514 RepID=UPI001BAF1CF7|nr:helix-turn-helix domain-containing protein [Sporosarcina sp. Marseille-Q4063]QUW23319.1 helix-turn-helix domain-containing protein [Sporosarcina sp. Marseille-Q4063]
MTNYLAQYAYFTNEFDLDKALSCHKEDHWRAMNHSDRDVLNVIYHYSVEFGVAHLKHDTIAAAIGKSNVTVRRAIRKLVKLGIIDRVHYIRPLMNGLGGNIYAIRPS